MMGVSLATTLSEIEALVPEWRALLDAGAPNAGVFHDPDVVLGLLSDPSQGLSPCFAVLREGTQLEGIAPFSVRSADIPLMMSVVKLGNFRARVLRLFGDAMIWRSTPTPPRIAAVFGALERYGGFDLIWIYGLPVGDPVSTFLTGSSAGSRLKTFSLSALAEKGHGLSFNHTLDEYVDSIRQKPGYPGKTIKRFWRDKKDHCRVECVNSAEQVHGFLDDVDRVYNASWQGRTYGKRSRNTHAEIERLQHVAAVGCLRSYLLKCGDTSIAFILGYQCRGTYTYDETGFDLAHSGVSPGSILTHAAIEDLFRSDTPRYLDFGFGDAGYKRTFGNISVDVTSCYVTQSAKWKGLLGLQRSLNAGYRLGRQLAVRLGIDARLRRILKR